MRHSLSVILGGAALALLPAVASAQIAITPLAGAYIPAGDLKAVQSGAETAVLERDGTLALGFNLEFGMLRGSLAYASGTTIRDADEEQIGEGNVLTAAADLVFRPLPRILVQPYLLGGVGLKNVNFDRDDTDLLTPFPKDDSDLALHAGIGADLMLGRFGIVAELTDYISKDEAGDWGVHDAFLMAGIKYRLGGN